MANDNVINLNCETRLDIPPDRVIEAAIGKLEMVVILGYEEDVGGKEYFASSTANSGEILLLIEKMKKRLLEF